MATQQSSQVEAPAVETIIVKKVVAEHHDAHHGGSWKVAYADFVTAMMAFFMLMWILNATTEEQKRGLADYFSPTLVQESKGGGANGVLAGTSIDSPAGALTSDKAKELREQVDKANFAEVERQILAELARDPNLQELRDQVRFQYTPEGLRIELIDKAGFSMFELGTSVLAPPAERLMREVARGVRVVPNRLAISGHTDALRYAEENRMNNWVLSSQRAEATRLVFADEGILEGRFARIEGVADTEPYNREDAIDPRNRRITVTLLHGGETQLQAALHKVPAQPKLASN